MLTTPCTALIMAGGRSLRMRQQSCGTHKSLRMVLGTPLIEWNLSALLSFGFRDIYVALNAREPELINWVSKMGAQRARSAGAHWMPIIEDVALGTIGAAARVPRSVNHLLVVNVDNLTNLSLTRLVKYHLHCSAEATIATHAESFRIPFGRLEIADGLIRDYQEKPEISVQISSGICVLSRRAIERIPLSQATDVPHLVQQLIEKGERVAAYPHSSRWIDINDEQALSIGETLLKAQGECWPGYTPSRMTHA